MDANSGARDFHMVVFGATGFAGRLVAEYLASNAPPGVAVGLAGRSLDRLESVRAGLPEAAREWPLLVAESSDTESLARLASSTRVLVSTVGPYSGRGLPLVRACAQGGTHYADLAGEMTFLRACIDECDEAAQRSGARIVPTCGVDSVPSDVGVWLLAQQVAAEGEGELTDTTMLVKEFRGGLGGGTVESLLGELRRARETRVARELISGEPYPLTPNRAQEPDVGPQPDLRQRIEYDRGLGEWVGPFVMAGVNTRIVRRSNALLDHAYGRRFRYREVTALGPRREEALRKGLGVLGPGITLSMVTKPLIGPQVERLLRSRLPKPGEGPDEASRRAGAVVMDIHTRTSTGARYVAHVALEGDPGFAATSLLLGQAALCLALDSDRLPDRCGVLTPATAMDGVLVDRLRGAGVRLDVERLPGVL
jgi:short subunit dehydrogenase-like uncharacterized protein